MPTPKPKAPTYGELSNIRTKLEMQQKNLKSKFPNDSVKVTHTMPDGKKITLSDVNKQLNKMNPKPKSILDFAVPVKGSTKPTPKVAMKSTPATTAKAKPNAKAPVRPVKPGLKTVKTPMPKQLTGDAAIKAYQREVSPRGVKQKSLADKKAIDKKYPGLYKSATPKPKKK